jgi:hypothetical protein
MRARRLDRRAHFLANGIEIDERTFRCAEGFALLHDPMAGEIDLYIYRTAGPGDVMVFAKPPRNVSSRRRPEKIGGCGPGMTYHRANAVER